MGLQLPGELVSLLSMLGYTWPEADEVALFEMGNRWLSYADTLRESLAEADRAARVVWTENQSSATAAFQQAWSGGQSPATHLAQGADGAALIGAGLMAVAGIVLALKISVIAQLVLLAIQIAQAIATAAVTFGASLAQIPIFKIVTKLIIDQVVDLALQELLNG